MRRRVASLEGMHSRFEQMEEEHHERLKELELSYLAEQRALFERRQEIISGAAEPTEDEVAASAYFSALQEEEQTAGVDATVGPHDPVGVPAFWSTVFRHSPNLSEFEGFQMSEADMAVLEYLTDVQTRAWEESDAQMSEMAEGWDTEIGSDPGFSIHLLFAPNPYLKDAELVLYCNGDFEVVQATEPRWREDKYDPTVQWVTKKVKKKGGGPVQKKLVAKPAESFFRIFEVPTEDEDAADWAQEQEGAPMPAAGGDERLPLRQLQNELVMRLREDVIPRAPMYYIGALLEDGEGMDGEGYEDEDWDDGPEPPPRKAGARR